MTIEKAADLAEVKSADLHFIQSYGNETFRIDGILHTGSIIVFKDGVMPWNVAETADINQRTLGKKIFKNIEVDILIIGCGATFVRPPLGLRDTLRDRGMTLEWMTTDAACRTFNVLLAEDRLVAAGLLAVA